MSEASKPKKDKPEEKSEKIEDEKVEEPKPKMEQPEKPIEETDEEETTEETDEEPVAAEEAKEPKEEPADKTEDVVEEEKAELIEAEEKLVKKEEKKPQEKPKKDRGPDFKYIVRISNTDVDGEKNLVYGLKTVKGISVHMATLIAHKTGIDRHAKMGDLKDAQVEKIQEFIDNLESNAPSWMLNHRKDYDTGEDIHLIGSNIDMRLRDEINVMKKIRCYRGIRHERGLPARGQRTRANNRRGLALGVSKKREQLKT